MVVFLFFFCALRRGEQKLDSDTASWPIMGISHFGDSPLAITTKMFTIDSAKTLFLIDNELRETQLQVFRG